MEVPVFAGTSFLSGMRLGVLRGGIEQDVPTGTPIAVVDGLTAPPHVRTIACRGMVIGGELRNRDPDAARMWMGSGPSGPS